MKCDLNFSERKRSSRVSSLLWFEEPVVVFRYHKITADY